MAHWNNLFCISFSHFISLGYFCSVALELERVGLRSASSPFDWLVSDFSGVIDLIENHFDSFWSMTACCKIGSIIRYIAISNMALFFFTILTNIVRSGNSSLEQSANTKGGLIDSTVTLPNRLCFCATSLMRKKMFPGNLLS